MAKELTKADRTRQSIIEQTAGIFNQKGYAGTSLSDLTDATKLTKGSIYGNFKNKEEVALAVFDYNHSIVAGQVQQRMAMSKTYKEKLLVYAKVYHSFSNASFPKGGCPILNTAVDADDTNELLKDKAAKAVLNWKKKIVELIRQGIAVGEFREGIDINQLALSIIALIEGGIMIAKVTSHPGNLDSVLKTVEQLINGMEVTAL